MPCATSYDPGWLPRRPVRAGGYAASATAPAWGAAGLAAATRAPGTSDAPTATPTPLMKSRRVIGRSIPSSRSAFLIAPPWADCGAYLSGAGVSVRHLGDDLGHVPLRQPRRPAFALRIGLPAEEVVAAAEDAVMVVLDDPAILAVGDVPDGHHPRHVDFLVLRVGIDHPENLDVGAHYAARREAGHGDVIV